MLVLFSPLHSRHIKLTIERLVGGQPHRHRGWMRASVFRLTNGKIAYIIHNFIVSRALRACVFVCIGARARA